MRAAREIATGLLALTLLVGPALPVGPVLAQASPPATITQPGPAATAPATPLPPGLPTLVPGAGDPVNPDEVTLPAKPVATIEGTSSWDDGLKSVRATIATIAAELTRLGIAPTGRPLAVYTQTDDDTIRFQAMIPIAAAPAAAVQAGNGVRFGTSPAGKAIRFIHQGAYAEIDTTFDTILTYLEAKDIVAQDPFVLEYLNEVADPNDAALELNIYVQPK